jgi:hypothetical protein
LPANSITTAKRSVTDCPNWWRSCIHSNASPAHNAPQTLQILADTNGLFYLGRVEDRQGRSGLAFSLPGKDQQGRSVRDILIFDETRGELLSYEQEATVHARHLARSHPGRVVLRSLPGMRVYRPLRTDAVNGTKCGARRANGEPTKPKAYATNTDHRGLTDQQTGRLQ